MSKLEPYPYQTRVAERLLSGKSVVLQAPTGSGKTTAALLPFFHAWREETDENFPSKCVYIVPMRVLAHQFIYESARIVKSFERRFRHSLDIRIQTGDQQNDKRFEGDLIFCTVDQFLSSYLTMPYSLSSRFANLNAGAMVGAYLVFDEFHLLDPGSTLPSALYVLKQLRQLAPVLLMTATFSATMLDRLASELRAEVVSMPPEEVRNIETRDGQVFPRERIWQTAGTPLSAASVLTTHQHRSLALCNTVKTAQKLFRELRTLIKEEGLKTEVMLLHSRFLPDHRRNTEDRLRRLFGKEADHSGSVILIATQAIEVGVDITCETLHTDLAPASALIQRAGRCARYPSESGQVIVYPVESFSPYGKATDNPQKEALWVREMRAALTWLQAHNGEVLNFEKEQEFVDAVATPRDEKILLELSAGSPMHAEKIQRVLLGDRSPGDQRLLVRDADSRMVLIHPEPDQLLSSPYNAIGFTIPTSALFGMLKDWLERDIEAEWRVKRLIEDKNNDPSEDNRTDYGWKSLEDLNLLLAARVLAVNPLLAGYFEEEGFVSDRGNTGFCSTLPPLATQERTWERASYRLESYENHIQYVLKALHDLAMSELKFPAQALERVAGWPSGSVLQAAWLVCLLHDVGKLSQGWQSWARAYQKQIGHPVPDSFAVAHTDSEWDNPFHQQADIAVRNKHPKPRHAGEGALATAGVFVNVLGRNELAKAAITAITRHHTPFASECQMYSLEPQAKDHIRATLPKVPGEVREKVDMGNLREKVLSPPNSFSGLLVEPGEIFGWLAYTLLARALRRADQEGTARGSRKEV